jgi:DNA-binding SARP family transcriptional activator
LAVQSPIATPVVPLGGHQPSKQLHLLGDFTLRIDGFELALSGGCQRLLAYLALNNRAVERRRLAALLWPDMPIKRGMACLRSKLWRIRQCVSDLVIQNGKLVSLDPDLWVDVTDAVEVARRVLTGDTYEGCVDDLILLSDDLLSDMDDDWILVERERLRQLHLNALETVCECLTAERNFAAATEAGLAAIAAEPFRESAHRALIATHIAQGNSYEALRQYHAFEMLVASDVGFAPSRLMTQLIDQIKCRDALT